MSNRTAVSTPPQITTRHARRRAGIYRYISANSADTRASDTRKSSVPTAPTSAGWEAATRVLIEQVGAVDVNRLGRSIGHARPEEIWGIDEGLLTVLGLG